MTVQNTGNSLNLPPLPTDPHGTPKITKILVANRGEIACRVISSCKKLGITAVAVFTDADRHSKHVRESDEAIYIGSIQSAKTHPHQDIPLLISTALKVKADAVHPGYGYLSENEGFAQAVLDAGLIWIGPSPESISVLGDKRSAKEYLQKYAKTVPLIPGFSGKSQDPEVLKEEAGKIGYPVLVKASAGGGGKGMRIVRRAEDFTEELQRAQSEAQRSFGNSNCLIEKYIDAGKHIEIQIFGDSSGNCISLFERECSIQRRHQKVIEEAPSPYMTPELRSKMSAAATELGRLLKYEGAGTVEFIVDAKTAGFYFLEVNTRVQVEHPITEETTLVDIVALQIYVASGGLLKDLPYLSNLKQHGHAIELRLCAEDPSNNFLPCTGTIRRFSTIHQTSSQIIPHVRYETGIETGSEVSVYFDPMIAKIVVWAADRGAAIRLAKRVLASTTVLGLGSNQEFLGRCLSHPGFLDKDYTTGFIEKYRDDLFKSVEEDNERMAIQTSMFLKYCADMERKTSKNGAFRSISSNFRVQTMDRANVKADHITIGKRSYIVQYLPQREDSNDIIQVWETHEQKVDDKTKERFLNKSGGLLVHRYYAAMTPPSEAKTMSVSIIHAGLRRKGKVVEEWLEGDITFQIDGAVKTVFVATEGDWRSRDDVAQIVWLHVPELCAGVKTTRRGLLTFAGRLDERSSGSSAELEAGGSYLAPMPCRILQVMAKDGGKVKRGDGLLVMESMKTEVKLTARSDGVVRMRCKEGDSVAEGGILCEVVAEEAK